MQSFTLRRYTVVAPHVRNDGTMSGYPAAFRERLLGKAIDGWTEYETHGAWRGKREAGVTFEFFNGEPNFVHTLARIARSVMPDQEAIQVTVDAVDTVLYEA
jgi:hypothetical protein